MSVTSQFIALVTYVKYPNLDLIINIISEKEKNAGKRERDLNWMENFTIESRYLKLINEFRAVVRCMKAAFYRPNYQKLLMCPLIKRLGQVFVLQYAVEPLKRSAELLQHSTELLRRSA